MAKKSIQTLHALADHQLIDPTNLSDLEKVAGQFAIRITEHVEQLIDKNDPQDPIAKQFVPNVAELKTAANERSDPIGDKIHTKVKGIIHRYPDRCLLTPVHVCPVYCRFCFRKETVSQASATLTPSELDAALAYIAEHKDIWEVILTGGDPLILKPAALKNIIARLNQMDHVEVIRLHTRVPMVDPERVNTDLVDALNSSDKAVYVLLHANHPNEFSNAAITACKTLIDAGIPMLSQTVLLKDINDNIETLSTLMRCFVKHRIKPYYLHHPDLATGTSHFRTTIQKGQELMQQLRGRFSGLCQPTYVLDIPGGYGKTPIGPTYISHTDNNLHVEDYCGVVHEIS